MREPEYGGMTALELECIDSLVNSWNLVVRVMRTKEQSSELSELCGHMHAIQNAVLANVACRSYPNKFRRL